MLKSLTFGGSLILIASTGFTQQTMQARPVGQLKDAGVYHVATGTWSRGGSVITGGADRLYNNSANTGFFGILGIASDLIWTDEGRIPSTGSTGNADDYTVNEFSLTYCSSVAGPQNGGILFYESYTSCTDILALTPTAAFGFQVPGAGAGSFSCWIVTFDVSASTLAFCMDGDADQTFDGTTALDNFGWTLILDDQGTGGFNGPFLNGDPNNFAYGDGTKFQNSGAAYATGLGTVDQFWLTETTGAVANGCYWFGGYPAGNPFASFGITIDGDKGCGSSYTKYCSANNNSTGAPADISGTGTSASSGTVTMVSSPVPNQPGIMFHALNQAAVPFGCSFLCATGNIQRGSVIGGVSNVATYVYDNSDSKHSLGGFVGATRNFQYWYRDPMNSANCGGQTFNTSNAISGTITP